MKSKFLYVYTISDSKFLSLVYILIIQLRFDFTRLNKEKKEKQLGNFLSVVLKCHPKEIKFVKNKEERFYD